MKKFIIIVLLLGSIALLGACSKKEEQAEAEVIDLGAQPTAQAIEAYGVVKATRTVDVTVGFPASVGEVNVKNGQTVQKDQVLMTLDTGDYNAQISEKECDLKILKAQKDLPKEQKDKIAVMEDSLALMKAKLENGNIRQNQIISYIDNGLVYNVETVKGDMVYSGSRIASIADLDSLIVKADIDEQFIGFVAEGAKVEIIPEYNKDIVIGGTVSFISSKAFQNNGETTVPVEITFSEAVEGLILDADVQVKIFPVE